MPANTVIHHPAAAPVESSAAAVSDTFPKSPRTGRRIMRRTVQLLIAALVTLFAGVLGQSTAYASQYNYDFDAYCNSAHTITAWAPDLSSDGTEWTVVWAPTLYRYNGSTWVKYLSGPTQTSGQGGTAYNWWIVQRVYFSSLPTGYYQVRTTYAWLHNGVKTSSNVYQPVVHKLDGTSNYSGNSAATLRYSTKDYCYES